MTCTKHTLIRDSQILKSTPISVPHHVSESSNAVPLSRGAKPQLISKRIKQHFTINDKNGGSILVEKILSWASEILVDS